MEEESYEDESSDNSHGASDKSDFYSGESESESGSESEFYSSVSESFSFESYESEGSESELYGSESESFSCETYDRKEIFKELWNVTVLRGKKTHGRRRGRPRLAKNRGNLFVGMARYPQIGLLKLLTVFRTALKLLSGS